MRLRVGPELSEWLATIRGVTRSEARSTAAPLPPLTLRPEEAAAIALALAAQPDGAYTASGRAALEKVLDVLEPDARRRADLLASSLWVSAEASHTADIRAAVERGVVERRVLVIGYRDGKGKPSLREVEPQLLARSSDRWFLAAWCLERQAPRWFRLDRVVSAEVTERTARRRDPALFGAPSETHPAGRALDHPVEQRGTRAGLRVLPGGRS